MKTFILAFAIASAGAFAAVGVQSKGATSAQSSLAASSCKKFSVPSTELGNGRAIVVVTAPCAGVLTLATLFEGTVTHKPGVANLQVSANGAAICSAHDYDFANYHLICKDPASNRPPTIPVPATATMTFVAERSNASADTTKWEMSVSFVPD